MLAKLALTGSAVAAVQYVDDVFSTFTYTGNAFGQVITNGIDLAGKGGLVWIKPRSGAYGHLDHNLTDTSRGLTKQLSSSSSSSETTSSDFVDQFNSNGFGVKSDNLVNNGTTNYASWTFRKAPKFFDVVTYTGTGVAGLTVNHSLGVAPGMILVKRTSGAAMDWMVYHRSMANTEYVSLNTTGAKVTGATTWNSFTPTASSFQLGSDATSNGSGLSYVAYLFAHDAAADGLIQCGTFTGATGGTQVTLGWEPQYVLYKSSNQAEYWGVFDSMRGMTADGSGPVLFPNTTDADFAYAGVAPNATGFLAKGTAFTNAATYIYLAIRRPNKPPTTGTQVYSGASSTASTGVITSGFATDLVISQDRSGSNPSWTPIFQDRLRGAFNYLLSSATSAEANNTTTVSFDLNNGIRLNGGGIYPSGYMHQQFKRARGVFDVVCFTSAANGSGTFSHSLGVVPEMVITKSRAAASPWYVYHTGVTANFMPSLNTSAVPADAGAPWTRSATSVTTSQSLNASQDYVSYLFATLAGISKVGSFTGNGGTQTINCGFTTGARFILIKRTDSTGDWFVWDTVRGIVAGNDPHLSLNTTAAEVTTNDSIDPDATGFVVNQLAATNINVNAASYIYLSFS